jgi:hypothetical protein
VFTVDRVDTNVDTFAFQLGGVVVVAATFARASATGSIFLMVYEVVEMRREGDEAEDLPNATYPSPLRQPFFVSVARVSSLLLDAVINVERENVKSVSRCSLPRHLEAMR